MIIFLYGKDSYRLKQNLDKIVAEYKKKHENGMAFHTFSFLEGSANELEKFDNALKTVGFFDEKQLLVLKEPFIIADKITELIKKWNLAGDKEKIVVFVENGGEAELNKKYPIKNSSSSNGVSKKLFALLTAKTNIVKVLDPLTGRQLENWVLNEAENENARIESPAVKKLIDYVGNDSWRLAIEVQKLANHAVAVKSDRISEKDIKLLVAPKINLNIFETIDALGQKNRSKAMVLLSKHLSEGEDPYYLFSMFVYQFRNLLRVKSLASLNGASMLTSDAVAKKTGLHPFAVRKMLEQSRKFELEELKQKFTRLADYDVAIKNGEIDIVDCLYQIALS